MASLIEHNLKRPEGLIECNSVLDIGAGIRPMNWYEPTFHFCTDPHEPYVDILRENGYSTTLGTAKEDLLRIKIRPQAIYLLDVIEHMEKEEGFEVIALASELAKKQVVLYTPTGFMEQEGDAWGLGGDHWQKHRSGWVPEEFPGWEIEFHGKSFFAVLTK